MSITSGYHKKAYYQKPAENGRESGQTAICLLHEFYRRKNPKKHPRHNKLLMAFHSIMGNIVTQLCIKLETEIAVTMRRAA